MASTHPNEPAVIAEGDGWRVVAKPARWHSVAQGAPDAGGGPTVEGWLREHHPEHAALPEAGLVHRLDFGTSGCLVAARTAESREGLRAAMRTEAAIRKTYLALVRAGIADTGSFRLHFSSRHKGSRKVTVRREGHPGECGRCRWSVVRRGDPGAPDLVEVELLGPGRRHQIRAGLAFLGHPLSGDALYGGDSADGAMPALHAWRVTIDGRVVECPAPDSFGNP